MKSRVVKVFFIIICALVLCILLAVGALAVYVNAGVDFEADEALFRSAQADESIRFYYDENKSDSLDSYSPVLFKEIKCSNEKREWYPYEDFSPYLINGFIAMEDRGFFSHHGIDVKRTLAATANFVFNRGKDFGGSTITQQVIKNISGNSEKTVKRKLDEIIRAYHIEYSHSKEEIFELYLNVIPMSNNITGIGLASKSFFGKAPSDLSADEAATLIAIANAPTRYNPYRHNAECKEKRDKVLYVMYQEGVIDYELYNSARAKPISVLDGERNDDSVKSWFIETVTEDVTRDLMKRYGYSYEAARFLLYKRGADIYTTVDPTIQGELEKYFENTDNFPDECSNGLEYSMVISDAEKNLLRGIVGAVGKKRSNGECNYALTLNTPGSALKPLALYLPLIDEEKIRWSTVFDDVPVSFYKDANGKTVEYPKNYPAKYDGLITASEALRVSKNTVAVRLYNMLGAEKIYKYLSDNFEFQSLVYSEKGINGRVTDLAPSPLALGQLSKGISLRKLTEAYNVFSNEGKLNIGRSYIAVFDSEGKIIIENKREERQVSSAESARVMTQLLKEVVESGTASKIDLKNIYDTAGKTGTSGSDRDRIFIGYTPYYIAGIWCGYPDKSNSVGNHAKNHFSVWNDVMRIIHEKTIGYEEQERFFSTENLVYESFCKDSGELFSKNCSYDPRGNRLGYGYFIRGTEPSRECDRHVIFYENLFPFLSKIALVKIEERIFPKEIAVSDEKYAYREKQGKNRKILY